MTYRIELNWLDEPDVWKPMAEVPSLGEAKAMRLRMEADLRAVEKAPPGRLRIVDEDGVEAEA